METIFAENINRSFDNERGIHGVSLSIRPGQCLGVLGANGSGKTTLTRLAAGLERVESGRLTVFGKQVPMPKSLRRRCGVALDTPSHWESLSGRQNLCFFARQCGLSGSNLSRRVDQLLCEAQLSAQADEAVADYSFGMRRKLSIIEAVCHDPDLLILDEPSAGIDVPFQQLLIQWINRRCEQGKTTWVADNNADWVSKATTDAILLCQGRINARGSVSELIGSVEPQNRVEILLEDNGFSGTPNIAGVNNFSYNDKCILAVINGDPKLPAELLNWITSRRGRVRSMEINSVTLHEALNKMASKQEVRL